MWAQFKSFYNKDNNDFSKGLVDPFEFHQTFYKQFVFFKVADLESKKQPSYFNQNTVIFIMEFVAAAIAFMSTCHGFETLDIPHITEAGSYTCVLSYLLFILYSTRKNIPQYHNLLRALKQDFNFICTDGEKYRDRYFEEQIKTWKICIFTCLFISVVSIGMNIFAYLSLLYFLCTHDADDGGSRPFLFPFWWPNVDFSKSPVYEISLIFANICVLLYAYAYICVLEVFLLHYKLLRRFIVDTIQTQVIWIRQITSRVDIVIWSLQDLLVDIHPATSEKESKYFSYLIETRMRDIVIHHQSMYSLMDDYAIVFKKILLFEQTICGPVVCLTAYCLAEKLEQGEFQAILLLLNIATIILHYISSYFCTFLTYKVKSVCEACWDIPFWNAGPVIRPYLVLIIQRSLRPLPLQAPGFRDISVDTFAQKMSTAFSYFNVLRQT